MGKMLQVILVRVEWYFSLHMKPELKDRMKETDGH